MKKLFDLSVEEISLVTKGANKKKFLIFKDADGGKMQNELLEMIKNADPEILKKVADRVEKIAKAAGDMQPCADSAIYKTPTGKPMSDRAQATLKAVGRMLTPFKDEITDSHMDAVQQEIGMQPDEPQRGELGHMASPDPTKDVDPKHHEEAMHQAKAAYTAHLEKMGYRKYPDEEMAMKSKAQNAELEKMKNKQQTDDEEDDEGDDVSKSAVAKIDLSAFDEKQKPQLEAIMKSQEDLAKKNEELEAKNKELVEKAATQEAEKQEKEIVAKADGWKHLTLKKEEVVETLKDAKKAGEPAFERVCKQFDTLNEQASKSEIFKEIGSSRAAKVTDAESALSAMVYARVEKSGAGKSREQLYEEVLRTPEGQKLYAEMKSQRPGGI